MGNSITTKKEMNGLVKVELRPGEGVKVYGVRWPEYHVKTINGKIYSVVIGADGIKIDGVSGYNFVSFKLGHKLVFGNIETSSIIPGLDNETLFNSFAIKNLCLCEQVIEVEVSPGEPAKISFY